MKCLGISKLISAILVFAVTSLTAACSKHFFTLPEQSQTFAQSTKYNNKVDILLMVDNSSSMSTYQSKLADETPAMITALNALGMDYNFAIVTTDMRAGGNGGKFVGQPKVLNRNTPDLTSLLTARVVQGTGGSDLEQGLMSIQQALSPNYLHGEGAGFLRADALLAIIALSDEDDNSAGSAESFRQFFDQLKPKLSPIAPSWVLNYIGIPNLNSTCRTALGDAFKDPGLKWIELANSSQGLVQSICQTTLADSVSNIKRRIVEIITDYPLNRKPKLESIFVRINDQVISQSNTNGWEFIPVQNVIRFHGAAVPDADDRVSVNFTPAEAM